MKRRLFVRTLSTLAGAASFVGLWLLGLGRSKTPAGGSASMSSNAILSVFPLDFQWKTPDPFLFCVHHLDLYPKGNAHFGPDDTLAGRDLGQDFTSLNGYRMYHGQVVPGFPVHPHRGFETITIVRRGVVDHADSLGAAGRYGDGDVQWMTAGSGIQHSEMFPLLHQDKKNTVELFQLWLNLPRRNKMASPHYKMFWAKDVPVVRQDGVTVELIAGDLRGTRAIAPPPDSWAADPGNGVALWLISLKPGAAFEVPAAQAGLNRTLYVYEGDVALDGQEVAKLHGAIVDPARGLKLAAGAGTGARVLLMQGRPVGEPVAQYGPFVMNTEDEIRRTIEDYRRTRFGGWPWDRDDMVHGATRGRFARYANGKEESPPA